MNWKQIILRVTALFSMSILTNCATLMHGTNQRVFIDSNPRGAKIIVDGRESWITPSSVELKRGEDHVVELKK